MREGWICPACGAGVAPGQSTCEHPIRSEPLPEDFPSQGAVELARAAFPTLDIASEAAKFRIHYACDRSARWPHVWRRWLEGERKWIAEQQPEAPPAGARERRSEERVKVWVTTKYGTRFESSLYIWQYEQMLALGTAPELVDPDEYSRMRERIARTLNRPQAG